MHTDHPTPLASRILDLATSLLTDAHHLPTDTAALTLADKALRDIQRILDETRSSSDADRVYLHRDLADEVTRDHARRVAAALVNNGVCGLPTGMHALDRAINGWEPGRVYMLGASSNAGKTTIALQWATHVAEHGGRALYLSLENSLRDLRVKNLCRMGGIGYESYLHGQVGAPEVARAQALVDQRVADRLALYCPDGLPRPLATVMEEAIQRLNGKPDLVVVDYLQKAATGLMGSQADDERTAIGRYMASLRQVAQQYECAVLAISSLNRASKETAGRGSKTADLGAYMGSATIEYGADVAMLLFDESDPADVALRPKVHPLRLRVVKNREGRAGSVALMLNGDRCLVAEKEG